MRFYQPRIIKLCLRYLFISLIFLAALAGLSWRVVNLNVLKQKFLLAKGNARVMRTLTHTPYRGMISDRHGEPLAISIPIDSVWANPQDWHIAPQQLKTLAKILELSPEQVTKRVQGKKNHFVYLKRHISAKASEQLANMSIKGLHVQKEYQRRYPSAEVDAHILGFTNLDGEGQEGVEWLLNASLKGEQGQSKVFKDRRGRPVEFIESSKVLKNGTAINLSLDQRLQNLAYQSLKNAVQTHHADSGSAVVLDVDTGEILVMVNQPSFDPNERYKQAGDKVRNRAVTDVFEPGSVIKAFSVLSALNSGRFSAKSLVDTSPGYLRLNGKTISDDNKNYGLLSVANVMKKSSNVGVSKLTLALPAEHLLKTYADFGFGQSTESGLPGESAGFMRHTVKSPHSLATMAFGYGLSVTPLQLAHAYASLGSGGIKRPISLYKTLPGKAPGLQIVPKAVAKEMLQLLTGVVAQSSSNAKVSGYQVAGKTGTTRKIGAKGYLDNEHIASFVGLIPAKAPRFSIVVMVNNPKSSQYYGNQIAAPIFSKIAAAAVRLYNVPSDLMSQDELHIAQIAKP